MGCNDCKYELQHERSSPCFSCCMRNYEKCNNQFQPKEKPMENKVIKNEGINTNSIGIYENLENKVIFESEEKARIHYSTIFPQSLKIRLTETDYNDFLDIMVNISKSNGYIRKSAVEEVEEMYKNYNDDNAVDILHIKQHEAIQEQHIKLSEKNRIIAKLEDEIERLKK